MQCGAGLDGHRSAAGAVRAPPQRVGEGVPLVEVAHHGHGRGRLIGGQREGDADLAVTPRLGCLDQLLSPLRSSNDLIDPIIANPRGRCADIAPVRPWRVVVTSTGCGRVRAAAPGRFRHPRCSYLSKIAAMPWPPPMHIVTSAYRPPVRRSSYSALTVRIAPVAPIGCPSETPLPFGLVRSGGQAAAVFAD